MPKYIPPPATMPPGALCWCYLRDSGGDSQEKSVEQQITVLREYCARHGLVLARTFADVARSGGSVAKRDQFLAMVDATRPPSDRPAALLIWNFARFARDVDDADFYKSTLRRRGIIIHSLTDPIPAGIFGPVVEKLIDVANQETRRQNSEAVKRALRELVKAGYAPGGTVPPKGYNLEIVVTGVKRDGKPRTAPRWVPDPELAPLVLLAFRMRAAGKSYREIAAATQGKLYTVISPWNGFFKNRSYLGIGKCGDEEFPNHHEPLVDVETFEAVQAWGRLHPREGLSNPKRIAYPSLLAGIAFCSKCGGAMLHHTSWAKHRKGWEHYICSKRDRQMGARLCDTRRVNARKVDAVVLDAVLNRILTPAYFEELLEETRAALADTASMDREIAEKRAALKSVNQSMSNLLDVIETFGGGGAAQERYKLREAEAKRLAYELQELETKRESLEVEITPEAMSVVLEDWRAQITNTRQAGDVAALRVFLARFIVRIDLDYDVCKIWYTFPMDDFLPLPLPQSNRHGGTLFMGRKAVTLSWRFVTC